MIFHDQDPTLAVRQEKISWKHVKKCSSIVDSDSLNPDPNTGTDLLIPDPNPDPGF